MPEHSTVLGIDSCARAHRLRDSRGDWQDHTRTFPGVSPYESDNWTPLTSSNTFSTCDIVMSEYQGAMSPSSPQGTVALPSVLNMVGLLRLVARRLGIAGENHPASHLRPFQKARMFAF